MTIGEAALGETPAARAVTIGEAARAAGVSPKAIRTWERTGLLPGAPRAGSGGYRQYTAADLATIGFVARARGLGFGTARIRGLLDLWADRARPSAEVKRLALGQVAEMEAQAESLLAMAAALRHLAGHCHGDDRPECPILDALGDAPGDAPGDDRAPRRAGEPRERADGMDRP